MYAVGKVPPSNSYAETNRRTLESNKEDSGIYEE
jgi:hypothetical protein